MTIWYRVSRYQDTTSTFSGDGSLVVSGRWHYLGKKVIYCSESIALCTLEWLAHNGLSVAGFNYFRYAIDISDDLIRRFVISDLPKDWNVSPATDATRDFAEEHLFSTGILALAVPSVIVPEEYNLVINASHPGFQSVAVSISTLGQFIAPSR